jgi:hypothetical protein
MRLLLECSVFRPTASVNDLLLCLSARDYLFETLKTQLFQPTLTSIGVGRRNHLPDAFGGGRWAPFLPIDSRNRGLRLFCASRSGAFSSALATGLKLPESQPSSYDSAGIKRY